MDAQKYLESLDKFGVKPGLERISLLLKYLDNPQQDLNIIHVGGTNGKGSTSAILTSIYKQAGFKVGTYNSPHIVEFNERFRIDDQYISDEKLDKLTAEIKPIVKKVGQELDPPSFFEVVTAIALLYFKQEEVDLAILEVGMGGRWDATNAVESLVSVITNVSLDHTDYLGSTLEEIAREKAGIIRRKQPVITGIKEEDPFLELKKVCEEKEAKLINIHDRFKWKRKKYDLTGQVIDVIGPTSEYRNLKLSLLGFHQVMNLSAALGVIEVLNDEYPVSLEAVKEGVADVYWPGRLEVISTSPAIILDGAHNQAAALSIKKFLTEIKYNNLILVLGVLGDKDVKGIIGELASQAKEVIITKNHNQRAASLEEVVHQIKDYKGNVKLEEELPKAVDLARELAGKSDLILISGSLYTVKEARGLLVDG